jgi:hypothetical protein
MTQPLRRTAPLVAAFACLCLLAASAPRPGAAQFRKREYLTPHEIESVRFAQELDKRTSLFIRVIERRLKLLAGGVEPAAPAPAKSEKAAVEIEGARPSDVLTRTRPELLSDIALALDEAIENIDDTASRAPESPLIGKSTKRLAEASQKFLPQLLPLRTTLSTGPERESLEQAIDNLQQIIEAVKKVKDEPADDKAKKKP